MQTGSALTQLREQNHIDTKLLTWSQTVVTNYSSFNTAS